MFFFWFGIFLANFKGWIELQTNKPFEIHHEIIASILRPSSSTALFFKSNFKVALYKKILVPERSHMNQSMSPCRFTFVGHFSGDMMPPQNLADFWRFDFNSQSHKGQEEPRTTAPNRWMICLLGKTTYPLKRTLLMSRFPPSKIWEKRNIFS